MLFSRKITSMVIALSMTFSMFAAVFFTETASAEIVNGEDWTTLITENFEKGQNYIEKRDSGLRTASDKDGYGDLFSTYTNNSGESLGTQFKRLEQGTDIPSTYFQTRPSLVNGYDTSGKVRIDFDMAKACANPTVTVIAVQGTIASGTSNTMGETDTTLRIANEQWLFSFEDALIYGWNTSTWPTIQAHAGKKWDKYSLVIDCSTDKYDVYCNDTKIIDQYGVGVDFSNIDSFKVVTKKSGPSKKTLETLVDNIRFYVDPSSSGWKQVFYEDFEPTGNNIAETGGSGYKKPSNTDGNGDVYSSYTNNSGDSLGTQFKRIAQGNNCESRYIQTRPSLTSGHDTSKVKIEFDLAKSETQYSSTVIGVQGDWVSGVSDTIRWEADQYKFKNEQWIFSVETTNRWVIKPSIDDWEKLDGNNSYNTPRSWEKYTLIIDCASDTYDLYINGTQKVSGYGVGVDFNSISSLKIITKTTAKPTGYYSETLVDNIRFYKYASSTWQEIFHEDFEIENNSSILESGNSGYRLPTDADGNGKIYSTYPNAMSIDVGTQFKRIEQGKGISTKYIQTAPALAEGHDTSIVKIDFDLGMSETWYPETVIAVQGNVESGTSNTYSESSKYQIENEQWLFSIYHDRIWGYDDTSWPVDPVVPENDHMKERWYHFKLIVNCKTDTYELWYNGNKVIDGWGIGMDFNSINSFKVVIKEHNDSGMKVVSETLVDNIVFAAYDPTKITDVDYSAGTLTATVNTNSSAAAPEKVILAAFNETESSLLGMAIANYVNGTSTYNMSISGLSAKPHYLKAFVLNPDGWTPSAVGATKEVE